MSFKAGDKVVCVITGVKNGIPPSVVTPHDIDRGPTIYCVESVWTDALFAFPSRIAIPGFSQTWLGYEMGFNAERFRLVHRCKDAVSVSGEQEATS